MTIKKITSYIAVCVLALFIGSLIVHAANPAPTSTDNRKILPGVRKNFEQKDVRNMNLEQREKMMRTMASSTEKIREIRASSTMMFKAIKEQKKEVLRKMKTDVFQIRKNALEKELQLSISNLSIIRDNISNRITKIEASTSTDKIRDMTAAKAALATADEKILKARTAVELFSNTAFTTISTSTVSTSTDVTLEKPRKIGDEAIKAVKEARDSLKKVVEIIAHTLGIKVETATSTKSN